MSCAHHNAKYNAFTDYNTKHTAKCSVYILVNFHFDNPNEYMYYLCNYVDNHSVTWKGNQQMHSEMMYIGKPANSRKRRKFKGC